MCRLCVAQVVLRKTLSIVRGRQRCLIKRFPEASLQNVIVVHNLTLLVKPSGVTPSAYSGSTSLISEYCPSL